jgi:hypothetical protein
LELDFKRKMTTEISEFRRPLLGEVKILKPGDIVIKVAQEAKQ